MFSATASVVTENNIARHGIFTPVSQGPDVKTGLFRVVGGTILNHGMGRLYHKAFAMLMFKMGVESNKTNSGTAETHQRISKLPPVAFAGFDHFTGKQRNCRSE